MARWIRRFEWDAVAGIIAAVAALTLHLLHVVQTDVVLTITLVLVAILLLRQLRSEERAERIELASERNGQLLGRLQDSLKTPEVVLVGPRDLRTSSERFARQARGNMIYFNVCLLMFRPQELFDCLLRPAVDNPQVRQIQFVLDEGARDQWREYVVPKLAACQDHSKVLEPRWCAMNENLSFILADVENDGRVEAQFSFWGEPFMARTAGREVPRYIFHVQAHSELVTRLVELDRNYRAAR
jgi:hypothetical protein